MVTAVAVHRNQTDSVHAEDLCRIVTTSSHQFLQPTEALQQTAVNAAKAILDPLAEDIAATQTTRRNENKRKRKRGSNEVTDPVLQLRQIYTSGVGIKQVWEQAKRILDAACAELERDILLEQINDGNHAEETGQDLDDDRERHHLSDGDDDVDVEDLDNVDLDETFSIEDELEDEQLDDVENIEDDSDLMASSDEDEEETFREQETYVQDPNDLNDGFFSIDDFNKQSQFLEQMDVRGDDEDPSDEDDIDWTVNPLVQDFSRPKPGRQQDTGGDMGNDDAEGDEEETGPTFGNADLNGKDSDEEDEEMDGIDDGDLEGAMIGLANTNDIRYADFFEPPPKKPSKNKRMRALPKTQPAPPISQSQQRNDEDIENDIGRAMADVRRDLLDSDDDISDYEDEDTSSDNGAQSKRKSGKLQNLSTHEKQKAEIAQEIRRLEAANVARKDWTLIGEASAGARPLNSLLDEGGNLEFERAGKPVPVITAEISEDIEALIKRRILAREFDEVVRRRPTGIGDATDTRRGKVEVDDTKPSSGLGEVYEQEHLRQFDPTSYVDKRSAATKKQHEEIDRLWKEVREQLDVLGNLHFKPKRLDVQIKTVEDKPRIAMEDARPAAAVGGEGDADNGGMLAPQEVYKPGVESRPTNGEVLVEKTGASKNKEEMTREEKLRRRRREKERQKKAKGNQSIVVLSGKEKAKMQKRREQQGVVDDLKRGGVKVIGKRGELQQLSGKEKGRNVESKQSEASSSALKL